MSFRSWADTTVHVGQFNILDITHCLLYMTLASKSEEEIKLGFNNLSCKQEQTKSQHSNSNIVQSAKKEENGPKMKNKTKSASISQFPQFVHVQCVSVRVGRHKALKVKVEKMFPKPFKQITVKSKKTTMRMIFCPAGNVTEKHCIYVPDGQLSTYQKGQYISMSMGGELTFQTDFFVFLYVLMSECKLNGLFDKEVYEEHCSNLYETVYLKRLLQNNTTVQSYCEKFVFDDPVQRMLYIPKAKSVAVINYYGNKMVLVSVPEPPKCSKTTHIFTSDVGMLKDVTFYPATKAFCDYGLTTTPMSHLE